MGSGSYSGETYRSAATSRAARGEADFAYTNTMRAAPPDKRKAHELLDVTDGKIKEARDSDDHPLSTPICVGLDQTGSMGRCAKLIHDKMPSLLQILLLNGYCPDPQISFGAIGDARHREKAPLQFGEFESDNRMDETIRNIFLEGLGGGGCHETYELYLWYATYRTALDRFEKRGEKGYLFIIGDEMAYDEVKASNVFDYAGGGLEVDLPFADLMEAAKKMWEIFFIFPKAGSYWNDDRVPDFWTPHIGQNFLRLEETEAVAELIGSTIGVCEGTVDLGTSLDHLRKDFDADDSTIKAVGNALEARAAAGSRLATATATGSVPEVATDEGAERL